MRRPWIILWYCLAGLVVWIGAQLGFVWLRDQGPAALPAIGALAWDRAAYLAAMPLCGGLLLRLLGGEEGRWFPPAEDWRRHPWSRQSLFGLGGGVLLFGLVAISAVLRKRFDLAPDADHVSFLRTLLNSDGWTAWLAAASAALLTPLLEESFYRLQLQRFLAPAGKAVAAGVSALLFAVAHPLAVFPELLLCGLCFAVLYWRCGPLAAILAHVVYNSLTLAGEGLA